MSTSGKCQLPALPIQLFVYPVGLFSPLFRTTVQSPHQSASLLVKKICLPHTVTLTWPQVRDEVFTSFTLHPNGRELVTASRNLMLRHWDISCLFNDPTPTDDSSQRGEWV